MPGVIQGLPRRVHLELLTPAELAIRDAILAVEALPADTRLTDAVSLLSRAKNLVSDYVDGTIDRQLVSGAPVPADHSHTELDPSTGQQKDYVVLTPEERAKGFVRPVRTKYRHLTCGTTTVIGQSIAETYARDPTFYSGTFCVHCREHRPLSEFHWEGDGTEIVGS